MPIQGVNFEAEYGTNMARGLVSISRWKIIDGADSTLLKTVFKIRTQEVGSSIYNPAFWTGSGPAHFHKVRVCGSFLAEVDGNLHS